MEITILYIISIILLILSLILVIFYFIKNRGYLKNISSNNILDIFDQATFPVMIYDKDGSLTYNKTSSKLAKHITDTSILKHHACLDINGTYYKISRFCISSMPQKEIIVFGHNNHKHDNEILQFLTLSAIAGAILDTNLNIISSNPILNQLIPITEHKISNFLDIISPEDHPKLKAMCEEHNQEKNPELHEFNILKYEKVVLIYINSMLLHNKKYFICKLFDITQYKTLEIKLAHAQRMQAVGELSGAIAHDFNNLLTAISGFCDLLLLRHTDNDKSYNDLMQIKLNAHRATKLVRQLLAFSSHQVLLPKILDVTQVITDLYPLLTTLLGQNIIITIKNSPDITTVKADQGQLEQVIINLVVNARDAMSNRGKLLIKTSHIVIDGKFKEENYIAPKGDDAIPYGSYILIEVEDTGTGISDDILEKIFEPFFSTKGPTYGTGLGLATVYGIIKQTGGYIRIQTKLNKGTKFSIFLTQATETKINNDNPISPKDEHIEKLLIKDNHYNGKILIVEDEISVRLFGKYALANKKYDVIEADNAEAAMQILETEGDKIDLIITDVMMPGMTGPEMAELIAKKHPHIKFIFTSGYAEDAVSYFSSGTHHFLSKPFSINELATKVKEVISSE